MNQKLNIIIILTLLLTLFGGGGAPAQAATGDLDLTFGTDGRVDTGVTTYLEVFFMPASSVQQSDGGIIVGGFEYGLLGDSLENGGSEMHALLEGYTADGALDTGFGTNGRIYPEVAGSTASILIGTHIGLQDEILAVGVYVLETSANLIFLARYDSAGVPVAGFGTDGILPVTLPVGWVGATPFGSALQSDGKLLINGYAYIPDPTYSEYYMQVAFLMRLDPTDGTLDATFGSGGVMLDFDNGAAFGRITLQSNGKILVTSPMGWSSFTIYRFTADGAPDESFGEQGVVEFATYSGCSALAEGPEGTLYLANSPYGTYPDSDFFLARLNADGSPDTNFGGGNAYVTLDYGDFDQGCSLHVQANGNVIVGGSAENADGVPGSALVRFTADGALDESFGSGGIVFTANSNLPVFITQLALTPGGKLLATGMMIDSSTGSSFTALMRYSLDGEAPNTPPVAVPSGPYLGAINTAIAFDGSGSSDEDGDPLSYAWTFGDGGTSSDAAPSHSYIAAGIYEVCLTVNDGTVDSASACTMAVVYDPSAGFVTGGGWIDSPAGAYTADPSLTGRATFGFVSKYLKGATVPTGNTEFQFQAGSFNFRSTSYDWLVVSKDQLTAQFKGSGTVNGALDPNGNPYKFMLWAGDGTPDTFRIKIWWESDGVENVVYDNGFNQAIGGGNIVVHTGK